MLYIRSSELLLKRSKFESLYPLPSESSTFILYFFVVMYLFIWLCWVLVVACGILFPGQELNPDPLRWERGVSATGPPGKAGELYFRWVVRESHSGEVTFKLRHNVRKKQTGKELGKTVPDGYTSIFKALEWKAVFGTPSQRRHD